MDRNKISMVLAERIGKLRAEAGESQQQLADALEIKRETVKFWESGERQIKGADIVALAEHFNVSADYLLGLRDTMTTDKDLGFVCEYTGLTEQSIETIRACNNKFRDRFNAGGEYDFLGDPVSLNIEETEGEERLSFAENLAKSLAAGETNYSRIDIFNAMMESRDFLIHVLSPLQFALGYKFRAEKLLKMDFSNNSAYELHETTSVNQDLYKNLKFELFEAGEAFKKIIENTFCFESVVDGLDAQFSGILDIIDEREGFESEG